MPILPAEPEIFPPQLFESGPPAVEGSNWWVFHTKPRQEKSLARHLYATKIPFYLPVMDRRHRIRGRIVTSQIPLFTGYLFVHATGVQRVVALTCNRVARTLIVKDAERLWTDLKQIHTLLKSGLSIEPVVQLEVGMLVEVTSGPLSGLVGKIIRAAGGQKFIVEVDFIQQGASVMLDDFTLKPLG